MKVCLVPIGSDDLYPLWEKILTEVPEALLVERKSQAQLLVVEKDYWVPELVGTTECPQAIEEIRVPADYDVDEVIDRIRSFIASH